jgi:hypothetical protein
MEEFDENTTYVLTATRTRATWREPIGNSSAMTTKSVRFRRGEKLEGIPVEQVARLHQLGHAVPEDEYDPEEIRRVSAQRRMNMMQAAAADAKAAVDARKAASGQPVAGLEDADQEPKREVDGIEVEDVDDFDPSKTEPYVEDEDADAGEDGGDKYDAMDYPQLVQEAKTRTGNGGGTKEELKQRLRDADANTEQ